MKCQRCGNQSDTFFCSSCEDLSIATLYESPVRADTSSMKVRILCTMTMFHNKQLCHSCIHRLKGLINGRCGGIYERAE